MAQNVASEADAAESLFAQALQLFPNHQRDVTDESPIMDTSSGLAARFRQICRDNFDAMEEVAQTRAVDKDALTSWQLERNTWDLIADMYSNRATPQFDGPSPLDLTHENPYTPELNLVRQALDKYPSLSELASVRDWLQRTAIHPQEPELKRGYWRFTKLELVHQLRSKGSRAAMPSSRPTISSLVQELDPDAVTRRGNSGQSVVLEPKDAEFEKALSQALYNLVRAGELDRAIDMCAAVDQPWRSAALRGAKAFSWSQLVGSSQIEDDQGMDQDSAAVVSWNGNRRRKLWRKACQIGASNPNMSTPARLLLSSLAPSAASLPVLSLGLLTWHDQLWARVSALLEDRLDILLDRCGGFWHNGLSSHTNTNMNGGIHYLNPNVEGEEEKTDEENFEEQMQSVLGELRTIKVNDGCDYSNRFQQAQYHIIFGDTNPLFEGYAADLLSGSASNNSDNIHQLRFFAHFCLFLRHIGEDVPLDAANVILQAYISLLEEQGRGDLVALYVGALGENAIQRYATFLSKLPADISRHDRSVALIRARDHGLDVEAVAFSTASLISREHLAQNQPTSTELPTLDIADPDAGTGPLSPTEMIMCRSVEWLTFQPGNVEDALQQANALMRYFVGSARVSAAREVLSHITPEVVSEAVNHPLEGPELVHFRNFFEVWDGFRTVHAMRNREPRSVLGGGVSHKAQLQEWNKQYVQMLETLREACIQLFTSGWLEPLDGVEYDARRLSELRRIREIFIPEMVLRLHKALMESRQWFPESLRHMYMLSTIVADERYMLYRDFFTTVEPSSDASPSSSQAAGQNQSSKNRLREFMFAMRETALAALENGNRDPFSVLQQV